MRNSGKCGKNLCKNIGQILFVSNLLSALRYILLWNTVSHAGSGLEVSHPTMPNIHLDLTIQRYATVRRYLNNQTVNHFCLCLGPQSLLKWHVECR